MTCRGSLLSKLVLHYFKIIHPEKSCILVGRQTTIRIIRFGYFSIVALNFYPGILDQKPKKLIADLDSFDLLNITGIALRSEKKSIRIKADTNKTRQRGKRGGVGEKKNLN